KHLITLGLLSDAFFKKTNVIIKKLYLDLLPQVFLHTKDIL
ncbi:MAG: hypothetical protein PWR23_1809, partial [Peptostreptococcaceae bacterium]|nr:hypothetical protein [Peptostreptococcaceae bacterium]